MVHRDFGGEDDWRFERLGSGMRMETLIDLLKMLVKGVLLLIGGLLLFGGGACVLIGIANIGQGAALLNMILIAVVVALVGWGMILIAKQIKRGNEDEK